VHDESGSWSSGTSWGARARLGRPCRLVFFERGGRVNPLREGKAWKPEMGRLTVTVAVCEDVNGKTFGC